MRGVSMRTPQQQQPQQSTDQLERASLVDWLSRQQQQKPGDVSTTTTGAVSQEAMHKLLEQLRVHRQQQQTGSVGDRVFPYQETTVHGAPLDFDVHWNDTEHPARKWAIKITFMLYKWFSLWVLAASWVELSKDYYDHWFSNLVWLIMSAVGTGGAVILSVVAHLLEHEKYDRKTKQKKPVKERQWPYAPLKARMYLLATIAYAVPLGILSDLYRNNYDDYTYNKRLRICMTIVQYAAIVLAIEYLAFFMFRTLNQTSRFIVGVVKQLDPEKSDERAVDSATAGGGGVGTGGAGGVDMMPPSTEGMPL